MAQETIRLAEYAAKLRYEDIPAPVLQRAKDCIADTTAAIVFGNNLPWSQMIVAYARQYGSGGKSRIFGAGGGAVQTPLAALANGALSHAFELDSVTRPPAGLHAGGALVPSTVALAQEHGFNGRDLLVAVVAGFEVGFRIGRATKHSNEARGFHAPGTTGPFAAAVACGKLLKFDTEHMTNALGIAGSLAGGLMEFARSGTGAMVKRLHLGRAAESGVLASGLAAQGFTGPVSVLEGKAGFLRVFCNEWDDAELTKGLGETYGTMALCIKRFAAHILTHTPVQAMCELQAEHRFTASQVATITVVGGERMVNSISNPNPKDIMMAQYSVPFCVSLAVLRDAGDPASFDDGAVNDAEIKALIQRVEMRIADPVPAASSWASTVIVRLTDGRTLTNTVDEFNGMPTRPLSREQLQAKFTTLTQARLGAETSRMFDRIQAIEAEKDLAWFGA